MKLKQINNTTSAAADVKLMKYNSWQPLNKREIQSSKLK